MTRRALEAEIPYAAGLLIGLLLAAPAFIDGYFDRYSYVASNNDFATFWVGARAVVEGHDPYHAADWPALAASLGGLADTSVFGYPGWVVVLLLPLGLLPLPVAAGVWALGGLTASILALRWLLRAALPGSPVAHTIVGMTLIASQPSRIALYWGQWQFALIAALIAAVALLRRHPATAGAAAGMLLVKPHLFLLALPALAARAAALRSARRFLLGLVAVGAAALVVSLIVLPGWIGPWISSSATERMCNVCLVGNVLGALTGADPRAMPTAVMARSGLGTVVGAAGFVAIVGAAALLMLRYPPRGDAGLGVWIALSLVAAPYGWTHDHLLLLPATVLVAGDVARRGSLRGATAVVAIACGILVLVASAFRAIDHAAADRQLLQSLVPGLMLLLFAVAAWPGRIVVSGGAASAGRPA